MHIPFAPLVHLLHASPSATLATHSVQQAGYPFASLLSFAPDERHRPVFLLSALAEHTKNLLADGRASLLVHEAGRESAARATVIGNAQRVEAHPGLVRRYLRYQPDAERYLALGDFAFFQLEPLSARCIEGFGRMGWLGAQDWDDSAVLEPGLEERLIGELAAVQPGGLQILGVDCYGIDVLVSDGRRRLPFAQGPLEPQAVGAAAQALLHTL